MLKILEETKALNLAVSPSSLTTERLSSLPGDEVLELWLNSIQVLEVSWSSLESIFGKSLDNRPSDVQILEVWLLIKVLKESWSSFHEIFGESLDDLPSQS